MLGESVGRRGRHSRIDHTLIFAASRSVWACATPTARARAASMVRWWRHRLLLHVGAAERARHGGSHGIRIGGAPKKPVLSRHDRGGYTPRRSPVTAG